jgi:hypothetical protein
LWKCNYYIKKWNKFTEVDKFKRLEFLANLTSGKDIKLIINKNIPSSMFVKSSDENVIILNKPSIITTLHETGHCLFGKSELLACVWSYQIFKAVFPGDLKKLKWKGHMLVK